MKREKDWAKVQSASEFYKMCIQSFEEYSDRCVGEDRKKEAMIRFLEEIALVVQNGYWQVYCSAAKVLQRACEDERAVFVGGGAMYSFLSFLAGITWIDPIERKWGMDMCFGAFGDRSPYMPLFVPSGYSLEMDEIPCLEEPLLNCLEECWKTEGASCSVEEYMAEVLKERPICEKNAVETSLKCYVDAVPSIDKGITDNWELFTLAMSDGTEKGLVRAMAAISGVKAWDANLRNNHAEGSRPERGIYTRDDILHLCEEKGMNEAMAVNVMDYIRKGRGDKESVQETLKMYGVDDRTRAVAAEIQYIVSEGESLCRARIMNYIAGNVNN